MGAENSVLEGCSWEDELVCPKGFLWKMSPIVKVDGTEAVVFQARNSEKKDSELLQKCAKTLLRLRHPNVIRFLGSGRTSKGCWMATEPVLPMLSMPNELTSEELVAGIQDILQALDFMHSKLGVCHNNICPSSVYISKDGGWKLGGIEHACKFQEATLEYLESCRVFRDESALAPEEKLGQIKIDLSLGHARDVFAVGTLVDALMDSVKEKDGLLGDLEQQLISCVSADPSQRPTVASLLNLPVFKSDFISIITFVKNVTMKTEEEKTQFFSHLIPKLHRIPETVIAHRLVVPMLSRFVLLNEVAEAEVLPHILVPRKDPPKDKEGFESHHLLSEELFKEFVIPHLCKIFRVHDSHIRKIVLKYFSSYVHLFSRQQMEEDIFLQVLLGVRDSDDGLVAASLRALADLVPILGGDYVIGGSRKTFFFHGLPKQVTTEMEQQKMSGPLNVGSVLSKTTSPLLKDIALGVSSASSISAEEREKKMKERQQRREEARLKREERRRKLKEKQLQDKEGDREHADLDNREHFPTPTIEEIAQLAEGIKSNSNLNDYELKQEENIEIEAQENVEKEASDWSDWENEGGGNISEEIEEELKNMSSQSSETESKVQTSPSPYRSSVAPSPPPIAVDWSDMPEADRTTIPQESVPSLYSKNSDSAGSNFRVSIDMEKSASQQSSKGSGEVVSSSLSPQTKGSLKLKSFSSSSRAKATAKKNTDDLGLGYDIKSIEIKTTPAESDFFADMAPKISLPSQKTIDTLNPEGMASKLEKHDTSKEKIIGIGESIKESASSSKFAFDSSSVAQEDASGWGADDDLDWGNDNF